MAQEATANNQASAEDIIAQADTGARNPAGFQGSLIVGLCLLWSLYQLFIASSLPFQLSELTGLPLNNYLAGDPARYIHLAFAVCLATFAFPLFKRSPRNYIPIYDWVLAALGVACCLYLIVFKDAIAERPGQWTTEDIVVSTIGVAVLMINVYRSLGLPLVIICSVFIAFVFLGGESEYLRDLTNYGGKSFSTGITFFWMQTEGVFGVAIGVSATMIFLFVLFGGILEKAGAGNWFIKVSVSMLGSLRGGPAKASVLSSALTGMISGSSIANTVTTGTFTIPLMRRIGFSAEKAGAVEVASSTNGQLTPPVMGAAAFLMVEFVGISYLEVIKHAFLPAVISYIALLYIVHLEALKLELKGLEKAGRRMTVPLVLLLMLSGFILMAILTGAVLMLQQLFEAIAPGASGTATIAMLVLVYIVLVYVSSKFPDIEIDDPDSPVISAPRLTPTLFAGLYYALPILVLVWNLMIERLSPAPSALLAVIAMVLVAITHHPLKAMFRGDHQFVKNLVQGWNEIIEGLISGARNMIGIGVATAAAGIIVGTLAQTGAHAVIVDVVEQLAGGNLILLLVLVAVLSLILGMGLPTTANYIIVSALMAPVIITVGQNSGLFVPLIAVHMFVFYFGILADDTPPVGLAAYAAAAISRGDPIKTGIQGFTYDIRTAALPFMFIFNTDLLLVGIDLTTFAGMVTAVAIFMVSLVAMLLFAAATQGYFVAKSRYWETAVLLLIAFTLFRPNFWMDKVVPPFEEIKVSEISKIIGSKAEEAELRLSINGPSEKEAGVPAQTVIRMKLDAKGSGEERLQKHGIKLIQEGEVTKLDEPFGGPFGNKLTKQFDFYADNPVRITNAQVSVQNRPPKELFFIPAFLLLIMLVLIQRRRATQPAF